MSDLCSWKGSRLMSPEGKTGTVIQDDNLGLARYLTVKFDDGSGKETVELNNVGRNPERSWQWKWLYNADRNPSEVRVDSSWVEFGER